MAVEHIIGIDLVVICAIALVAGLLWRRVLCVTQRAQRDALTNLYNHGYIQENLNIELQRARRYGRPLSVLMVDIDHFKFINDTYGHWVGDEVLHAMAGTALGALRTTDVLARYGGEELLAVLPETDADYAYVCAERLRQSVEAATISVRTPREVDTGDIKMTVSVGVASFPENGDDIAHLIEAADAALVQAKLERNKVVAFSNVTVNDGCPLRFAAFDCFLRDSSMSAIRPLVAAIDVREPGCADHSEKTAQYAVAIGTELGFSTQLLSRTCKAALLHDVGNIGVSEQVLSKKGPLTSKERRDIMFHTRIGAQILSKSPQLATVADCVLHHHERFDGAGYPDGLAGEAIPLISRVVTVADVLDALTSNRCYRMPMTMSAALAELQTESGKQFDPKVVQAAVRVGESLLGVKKEDEKAA